MRVALDAMGGDLAPDAAVEGGVLFAREHPADAVVLVGDEARVRPLLQEPIPENLTVRHASEVVAMDEHAGASIRKKRDSSMRVCFELMRSGEVQAMVSAGNSGAVMAGALLVLGRLPGVERPAFAATMPSLSGVGRFLLLDAGANVEAKPSQLAQFGVMGEAYVRKVWGVPRPKVAVLSNGEEDAKGTDLTRETAALLRTGDLDFTGYVEGKDLFSGQVEVVVTDGFTGNVVLKTSEGTAAAVGKLIKAGVQAGGFPQKLGALLMKSVFAGLKRRVDYAEYGGAPLLGVEGVTVVAHGRSTPKAVKNALRAAVDTARAGLEQELSQRIAGASAWLPVRGRGKQRTAEAVSD